MALLAQLDNATLHLPSHILEAAESDDIARIVMGGSPNDPVEAWEHLDCLLNRFLGYGMGVDEVVQRLWRGPLGIEGLSCLI